ncbi:hypothetical protein EWE75_20565 [Sphingomonas populi]|uniref:Uncharacterized protein n=1 Tax=Sphingomonas populi TaxID=2484750 RepID=A0A4Q6XWQ2_9SPHN|nr:hypothetical protein [Sphingomonas populi]RZF60896.1 hypothetical protein EWE75_20565 [Sphingomonas populi]
MRSRLKSGDEGQVPAKATATQAVRPGSAHGLARDPGGDLDSAWRDLAAADSRGDRLAVRLSAARDEAARLRAAAIEADREKDTMASAMARLHDGIKSRDGAITAMAEDLRRKERELEDLRRRADGPQPIAAAGQAPALDAEANVQLAGLRRRLRTAEEDAALQRSLVSLLTAMLQVLSDPGRWWFALLPGFWIGNIKSRRLRRKTLFDARLYAKRYPDVGRAGMDPLHHYVSHGLEEGRLRI